MPGTETLRNRLPRAARIIEEGVGRLHPGMQVYVSRGGRVLVDEAVGTARDAELLSPDHCMPWLSAGKPITAAAVLQLVEEQRVSLDAPVVRYIPEFATHGKEDVTVRHLLTHTAGLQPAPTGWPRRSWDEIVERICQGKLRHGSRPGEQAAYDPGRSWFVLGEILQRCDGVSFEESIRRRLLAPLGLAQAGWTLSPETTQAVLMHQCDEQGCRISGDVNALQAPPSPGSSFRAPACELGRFYEMLLSGGVVAGRRILAPETVQVMTSRHRIGMLDLTFQHRVDFGLGLIVNSNRYGAETVPYGFGRHASPESFGHGGSECAIAFADPREDLVVVVGANGRPGEAAHQHRHREICSAIYVDLGITAEP